MPDPESHPFAFSVQDDCENVSCEKESPDIPGGEPKSPHFDDGEPKEYFYLDGRPGGSTSLWNRTRMYLRPWKSQSMKREAGFGVGRRIWLERRLVRRPRLTRLVIYTFGAYLLILGFCQFLSNTIEALTPYIPDHIDWLLDHWGQAGEPTEGFGRWPTDDTGDIPPVSCHSHNDYWRRVPLFSAIHAGCIGVEADVWLVDGDLHVGHRSPSLTSKRTLRNLYLDPLLEALQNQNPVTKYHPTEDSPPHGVFDTNPDQPLVFLIDFKTSGTELWPHLYSQLSPLRDRGYLTHFDGSKVVQRAVTIVGTGNAPFDLLAANQTYRDVFFDAPLGIMADLSVPWPNPNRAQDPTRSYTLPIYSPDAPSNDHIATIAKREYDLGQGLSGHNASDPDIFDSTNSYYASVHFGHSIGRIWGSRLSQPQLQLIRGQIQGAHQRGLKVRYFGVPIWPTGLRNHLWHILIREGVDILNVDDLVGATRRDWRRRKGWWY